MIKYPDGQSDLPAPQALQDTQREVAPRYQPGPLDHYCPEEQGTAEPKPKVIRSERHR